MYDPNRGRWQGWLRNDRVLEEIERMRGWDSPRLGMRFELEGVDLALYYPDGKRFLIFLELNHSRQAAESRAKKAEARVWELEAKLKQAGSL